MVNLLLLRLFELTRAAGYGKFLLFSYSLPEQAWIISPSKEYMQLRFTGFFLSLQRSGLSWIDLSSPQGSRSFFGAWRAFFYAAAFR
jgi:hypothetical protein